MFANANIKVNFAFAKILQYLPRRTPELVGLPAAGSIGRCDI